MIRHVKVSKTGKKTTLPVPSQYLFLSCRYGFKSRDAINWLVQIWYAFYVAFLYAQSTVTLLTGFSGEGKGTSEHLWDLKHVEEYIGVYWTDSQIIADL